jgi:hypothetical protein
MFMTELTNYLVGKIDQLYIKAFHLCIFLIIFCAVVAVFVLITVIVMAITNYFFFPQGIHDWILDKNGLGAFLVLIGIGLLTTLIFAYIVAKRYFIKFMRGAV